MTLDTNVEKFEIQKIMSHPDTLSAITDICNTVNSSIQNLIPATNKKSSPSDRLYLNKLAFLNHSNIPQIYEKIGNNFPISIQEHREIMRFCKNDYVINKLSEKYLNVVIKGLTLEKMIQLSQNHIMNYGRVIYFPEEGTFEIEKIHETETIELYQYKHNQCYTVCVFNKLSNQIIYSPVDFIENITLIGENIIYGKTQHNTTQCFSLENGYFSDLYPEYTYLTHIPNSLCLYDQQRGKIIDLKNNSLLGSEAIYIGELTVMIKFNGKFFLKDIRNFNQTIELNNTDISSIDFYSNILKITYNNSNTDYFLIQQKENGFDLIGGIQIDESLINLSSIENLIDRKKFFTALNQEGKKSLYYFQISSPSIVFSNINLIPTIVDDCPDSKNHNTKLTPVYEELFHTISNKHNLEIFIVKMNDSGDVKCKISLINSNNGENIEFNIGKYDEKSGDIYYCESSNILQMREKSGTPRVSWYIERKNDTIKTFKIPLDFDVSKSPINIIEYGFIEGMNTSIYFQYIKSGKIETLWIKTGEQFLTPERASNRKQNIINFDPKKGGGILMKIW